MKRFKILLLCVVAFLTLSACGFKQADSAKQSMEGVHQSAGDLKDETKSAKDRTEEIKQEESQDSTEGYKW
ncbi:hypothetical protein [Maridesulfovibrio salexigens]|uniref:Lipoprotein n=1 Tax=Maridesulfovibrio salexigens (strain ATCC 14822 / DSM 2638 / NCIMB 8403 / VKM B-1763) TaxID=526222 RepID=C6C1S5_MARSD|nr:hypothetical protein [Maridesulfovibrio salexigens]ACS79321.1 hypothetical protein Desal_1258 [Maridesulfovibrio salexigens DSM 2638]